MAIDFEKQGGPVVPERRRRLFGSDQILCRRPLAHGGGL